MITTLELFDILISLFYIVLIIILSRIFQPDKDKVYYKYYSLFIYSKIFFSVSFALLYIFYFGGGDTFLYFNGGNFFVDQILHNPSNIFNLLFNDFENLNNLVFTDKQYLFRYFQGDDILLTSKILSFFCFIGFKQYLTTTILFTIFTSIGLWKLFTTLCNLYPSLNKYFAVGILFYPTIGIWGSGILKDPLTMALVGMIFYSLFNILKRKNVIFLSIIILASIYVCLKLKPYILYTFLPAMILWIQGQLSAKLKNPLFKIIITPIILIVFGVGGFYALNSVSEGAGKYSIENVQSVAEGFHSWHTYLAETRDQSGYSLGEVSFTPIGVLQKAPESFFVTYYRPFIFGDVRNAATLFEALQNLILLLITIYIIIKVGFFNFFRIIITDKNVRAFMLFAIVFGIAVGITSYNFGALSRYKIPSLPFFTAALSIIYYLGYLKPKGIMQ